MNKNEVKVHQENHFIKGDNFEILSNSNIERTIANRERKRIMLEDYSTLPFGFFVH